MTAGHIEILSGRSAYWMSTPGAGPPIILLGGCGVPHQAWRQVLELLPDLYTVVLDRPGISTPWPGRLPLLDHEVATLAALIDRVGGPAVLVAHSMAAFHAEGVLRRHPGLVAGLVLVDASIESKDLSPRGTSVWLWAARLVHLATAVPPVRGCASLISRILLAAQSTRGGREAGQDIGGAYQEREAAASVVAEFGAYRQQSIDLAALRRQTDLPAVPTVVITAAKGSTRRRLRDQALLTELMGADEVQLGDARHMLMLDRPDVVATAIRWVRVGCARSS